MNELIDSIWAPNEAAFAHSSSCDSDSPEEPGSTTSECDDEDEDDDGKDEDEADERVLKTAGECGF